MSKKSRSRFKSLLLLFFAVFTTFVLLSCKLLATDKKQSEDSSPHDYELTGWLYIGPSSYQLVYRFDSLDPRSETGQYVLVSNSPKKPSIVLREERHTGGEVSSVVHTPDNSTFIITSHMGDGSQKLLVGVNLSKESETLTPIESQILEFGDTYYINNRVLSFLDDSTILVKTTQHFESGGEKETYWHAPIANLTKRTYVSLP